jgi:hypothetical protein
VEVESAGSERAGVGSDGSGDGFKRRFASTRPLRSDPGEKRKSEADGDADTGGAVDASARPAPERRAKKERRRRIDPTTFEKQYTDDELEFMNAMQRFKVQSGKSFPSHGDVLRVAHSLGYRQATTSHAFENDDLGLCGLLGDDEAV